MKKKKILILKDASVDWEKYFSEKMRISNVNVDKPYKRMGKIRDFICHVFMHYDIPGYPIFFDSWKQKLIDYDVVIIFDRLYSQNIIKYIKRKKPDIRIIFWYWNVVETDYKRPKYFDMAEYWTFDKGDAKEYGMNLNIQFYFRPQELIDQELKYDVLFIGKDKGRAEKLVSLRNNLASLGFKTNFMIIRDDTSNGEIAYTKPLKYKQIIEYIKSSKCIVDLYQEGQTGLTLRPLEALYLQRLLITNNESIRQLDFYSDNNVLILPADEDKLRDFLSHGFAVPTENVLEEHSYRKWLRNFGLNVEE